MSTASRLRDYRIGALDRRVTIEQESRTADGMGGFTRTWSTFATVWARIQPLSGTEKVIATKLQQVITHRVLIRYNAGVVSSMRLNFNGRIFQIKSVRIVDEGKRWIEIGAQEGVGS